MDTVRFGRALGFGARSAAKTLVQAIDAARSDNPSSDGPRVSSSPPALQTRSVSLETPGRAVRNEEPSVATRDASTVVRQGPGVRHGIGRFRDLALRPFVRLSGVLLLEVCGVFFGIFALYGFNTMWRVRTAWHASAPGHRQFLGGLGMLAVFGYFCISSFVRARRRERSS